MKSVLFLSAILGIASTQQSLPHPSGLGSAQTAQAETPVGLVTDDATNDPDGVLPRRCPLRRRLNQQRAIWRIELSV